MVWFEGLQWFGVVNVFLFQALWIQLPSQKVFNLLKTPQTTFLEGIWILREGCIDGPKTRWFQQRGHVAFGHLKSDYNFAVVML